MPERDKARTDVPGLPNIRAWSSPDNVLIVDESILNEPFEEIVRIDNELNVYVKGTKLVWDEFLERILEAIKRR